MAETAVTNFDDFREKDCVFVADWLKTKGLHKLYSVLKVFKKDLYLYYINMCCLINHVNMHRLTNRFHVAVRLLSNRSQMTSKCGKNKKVTRVPL